MRRVGGLLISLPSAVSLYVDKPLKSVMHGQCSARPTVTFPATGRHYSLTSTKLYCLVTEAHVCEQLAQGCYLKCKAGSGTRDLWSRKSHALTTAPPGHTCMAGVYTWWVLSSLYLCDCSPFVKKSLYEMTRMASDIVDRQALCPGVVVMPPACLPVMQFAIVSIYCLCLQCNWTVWKYDNHHNFAIWW